MKRHLPTLILSALIVALLTWYFWPASPPVSSHPATPALPPTSGPQSKIENPKSKISAPPPAEHSTLADTLNSPKTTIRADLAVVNEIIGTFRTNFPRDGNPVGTNAEITAALTGKNKLSFAFIPPNHPAINRAGELCDRWGTPFYFHAESGTRMTIRSAGPDKKLHTDDDAVLTP